MSIATPIALALSASVLCLAVIYTVDWTPTTRIKGVLMLVGLAYFGAVSLYFLKKEMVERIKRFTGLEDRVHWQDFSTADYRVRLPGPPEPLDEQDQPLRRSSSSYYDRGMNASFWDDTSWSVGSLRVPPNNGDDNAEKPGTATWFKEVEREIVNRSGGKLIKEPGHGEVSTTARSAANSGSLSRDNETNPGGSIYRHSRQGLLPLGPGNELGSRTTISPRIFFRSFEALNAKP